MTRLSLVCASLLLLACPSAADSGACQSDLDCKGDRICADGSCVSPQGQTSGSQTSGPAGTTDGGEASAEGGSTRGGADAETTDAEDATSTSGGSTGGVPEQPYGRCKQTCSADADCCPDGCPSGTDYTCDDGLCRSTCVPAGCDEVAGVRFDCVTPVIGLPDESFCGAPCEGNDCSDIGPAPAFYCNPDQAYAPPVCGYDCRVEDGPGCTGSSGSACLPTGDCGCMSDADCQPDAVCFKQWTP